MPDLTRLQQRHDHLYRKILSTAAEKPNQITAERARWVREMDELLGLLQAVPTEGMSASTYDWLTTALINWQVASAAILDEPREVRLPQSPETLLRDRSDRVLSDEEVEKLLGQQAHHLSLVRRARELTEQLDRISAEGSSDEALAQDWRGARVFLAYELLSGQRSFSRELTSRSFRHLVDIWLTEVKSAWAFVLWKERGSPLWDNPDADYLQACHDFESRLREPASSKAQLADFAEAEEFLRRVYLSNGDRVRIESPNQEETTATEPGLTESAWSLVRRKAERWAELTGHWDPDDNWRVADNQVRDFYDNITAAVRDRDRSSTERVVRAVVDREGIANALEAALAVSFLDGEMVREILENAD